MLPASLNRCWSTVVLQSFRIRVHFKELGIPLVIPDINPEHMSEFNSSKGMHACATNCTLVPMAVPIAALRQWDVIKVSMRSEQALSGAGWRVA